MALLRRHGALIATAWLGLVGGGGCAAAKPKESAVKPAIVHTTENSRECAHYDALQPRVDAALASGNLLGARRLLEQFRGSCSTARDARSKLAQAMSGATGEVNALLASAGQARSQGRLQSARRSETLAASLLEASSGERLRVVQRWSTSNPGASGHAPYLFTTLDGQVSIFDARTGTLQARIPQPGGEAELQFQIDLDPQGTRVLGRSIDLTQVGRQDGCASTVDIFDAPTGKRLKRECAMQWAFSDDGSRLALSRFTTWGDGAVMKVVVLDTKSLKPVLELPEPDNVSDLQFAPDGTTLVVRWSNAVSMTDLTTGKTDKWSGPPQEGAGLMTMRFLTDERSLLLDLVAKYASQSSPAIYDTKRQRWLSLTQGADTVEKFDAETRSFLVEGARGTRNRLFVLDSEHGSPRASGMVTAATVLRLQPPHRGRHWRNSRRGHRGGSLQSPAAIG